MACGIWYTQTFWAECALDSLSLRMWGAFVLTTFPFLHLSPNLSLKERPYSAAYLTVHNATSWEWQVFINHQSISSQMMTSPVAGNANGKWERGAQKPGLGQ